MAPRSRVRSTETRQRVILEFAGGARLLLRGLGVWATAPGLMALGMLPALIVGLAFIAGLVALGVNIDGIVSWMTPFTNAWDEPFRSGTRVLAALATFGVAILVMVYLFTTVTLIVGQPFYERIWMHVERRLGQVPENPLGFWRALWRGLGAAIRLVVPTVLLGIAVFLVGLIPAVGQVIGVMLGALLGGWLLSLELTGLAFDARGMTFLSRRATLRGRRAAATGFGAAVYLAFLVPLGAVIMMPAAVAGATLLARRALGEASEFAPTVSRGAATRIDDTDGPEISAPTGM